MANPNLSTTDYDDAVDAARLRERVALLEAFVRKFADNFDTCDHCNGKGTYTHNKVECGRCHGTGKQIDSLGVLFVELPEDARALLNGGAS